MRQLEKNKRVRPMKGVRHIQSAKGATELFNPCFALASPVGEQSNLHEFPIQPAPFAL